MMMGKEWLVVCLVLFSLFMVDDEECRWALCLAEALAEEETHLVEAGDSLVHAGAIILKLVSS